MSSKREKLLDIMSNDMIELLDAYELKQILRHIDNDKLIQVYLDFFGEPPKDFQEK